ncbi:MAG: Wzz/FepE/Etk N-terminal domain-containing protein [Oscillospiraceae bacterium]|nr:Wzz/FepE/Etk N-terminal domain-containing protein [Oscillospiraceae bacterium]
MKEISIMYILNLALRRLWALILAAVVFACAAFGYCKFLATPRYSATASILVTNGAILVQNTTTEDDETVSSTDISASVSLMETVIDILKTPDIFRTLSDEIGNRRSYSSLKGMISIASRSNRSLFIDITFTATSSEEAIDLVNKFVALAPDYISDFIPYSYATVTSTADGAALVYPKTTFLIMVAAVVGAVLAFAVAFIVDSFDHAILGEADLAANFDIPIIGTVPDFESVGVLSTSNQTAGGKYNAY